MKKWMILLIVFAAFLAFLGVMTKVSMDTYEEAKPVILELGFAENRELTIQKEDNGEYVEFTWVFRNVLPIELIQEGVDSRGRPSSYVYILKETEGLWGQTEIIALQLRVWPEFYGQGFTTLDLQPEITDPVVFEYEGFLYDGAKVRLG